MRPPRYGTDALRDPDDDDLRADAKCAEGVNDRIMADFLRGMAFLDAAMQPRQKQGDTIEYPNVGYLDRTDTKCQPCDHFSPHPDEPDYYRHSCPYCEGLRCRCACGADHHTGGWQSCPDPRIASCSHPACVAVRNKPPADVSPPSISDRDLGDECDDFKGDNY